MGFEPHLALDGGCDGLYKIIKVINKASALIKRNGIFILEIGHEQKNKIVEILRAKGFYIKEKIKDYGKKYRCIVATKI